MAYEYYIGMMSGTSMDSIDVVLCGLDETSCKLLASYEHPFPTILKDEIITTIQDNVPIQTIGALDHRLGLLFSEAVNTFIDKKEINREDIVAIGSHGQTLWHEPLGNTPFTMQLGDPNIIVAKTGLKVVANFRHKDMAFGGSGAPLAPAFHQFLFDKNSTMCIVNIGGIANITVLGEQLLGYDIGPGNMLMDAWIQEHQDQRYDENGVWSKNGSVNYTLLDMMMADSYFAQPYPKSTGREKFNIAWLNKHISTQYPVPNAIDIQRTLLELTAQSISNEVLKFSPDMLLLSGGGANNIFLIERIATLMPNIQVSIIEQRDWIEGMMMAWLAYKRIHEVPINLKEVTGAKKNTILGIVYI
ncbi:MAG: anhydro-N-acetylmuramic acid kinase [Sulfurovum sp.]|nr:anhydro-N-acetylmuramic acid kinase [Sulfurovum sp.]MCB4760369.1 anhydro-N-acetylmuramic acid kinase [Sulfurovum sp.]